MRCRVRKRGRLWLWSRAIKPCSLQEAVLVRLRRWYQLRRLRSQQIHRLLQKRAIRPEFTSALMKFPRKLVLHLWSPQKTLALRLQVRPRQRLFSLPRCPLPNIPLRPRLLVLLVLRLINDHEHLPKQEPRLQQQRTLHLTPISPKKKRPPKPLHPLPWIRSHNLDLTIL